MEHNRYTTTSPGPVGRPCMCSQRHRDTRHRTRPRWTHRPRSIITHTHTHTHGAGLDRPTDRQTDSGPDTSLTTTQRSQTIKSSWTPSDQGVLLTHDELTVITVKRPSEFASSADTVSKNENGDRCSHHHHPPPPIPSPSPCLLWG